ncbi:hypothetical protein BJ508DRAFT_315533 [Ascobolus immersus RN42]|uniref:Uncharacterized protein n=1 Tax=Ascobolus immersus RN42 TaxID=1160509 RepID=A0A3N4HPD0_ASCIM|nr:hypothetical protein BJ508DRAFT_315533 [Ascobolus immersus RN42]
MAMHAPKTSAPDDSAEASTAHGQQSIGSDHEIYAILIELLGHLWGSVEIFLEQHGFIFGCIICAREAQTVLEIYSFFLEYLKREEIRYRSLEFPKASHLEDFSLRHCRFTQLRFCFREHEEVEWTPSDYGSDVGEDESGFPIANWQIEKNRPVIDRWWVVDVYTDGDQAEGIMKTVRLPYEHNEHSKLPVALRKLCSNMSRFASMHMDELFAEGVEHFHMECGCKVFDDCICQSEFGWRCSTCPKHDQKGVPDEENKRQIAERIAAREFSQLTHNQIQSRLVSEQKFPKEPVPDPVAAVEIFQEHLRRTLGTNTQLQMPAPPSESSVLTSSDTHSVVGANELTQSRLASIPGRFLSRSPSPDELFRGLKNKKASGKVKQQGKSNKYQALTASLCESPAAVEDNSQPSPLQQANTTSASQELEAHRDAFWWQLSDHIVEDSTGRTGLPRQRSALVVLGRDAQPQRVENYALLHHQPQPHLEHAQPPPATHQAQGAASQAHGGYQRSQQRFTPSHGQQAPQWLLQSSSSSRPQSYFRPAVPFHSLNSQTRAPPETHPLRDQRSSVGNAQPTPTPQADCSNVPSSRPSLSAPQGPSQAGPATVLSQATTQERPTLGDLTNVDNTIADDTTGATVEEKEEYVPWDDEPDLYT